MNIAYCVVNMPNRHQQLTRLLLKRGRLTVAELADRFGVTGMTVRRDLQTLEDQGVLTRTHGGCVLAGGHVHEQPFREKELLHRRAKEAIARRVVAELPDGVSLYLDTGTTGAMVAGLLPAHRKDLRVFTNSIPAAMAMFGADGIDVVVLGGSLGRRSPDLSGPLADESLKRLRFDVAIVGADAIDIANGEFYAADQATANLSRSAQSRAERVYACIDASKFNKRSLVVAGTLGRNVSLFTDAVLSAADRRTIRRHGVETSSTHLRRK